jgi:hypothetical protein
MIMNAETKKEIIAGMRLVALQMLVLSNDMSYYGGLDKVWQKHAVELCNASEMLESWAKEAEDEEKEGN